MDILGIGFLFLIVGIVLVIGIVVEVWIRRNDRRGLDRLEPQVRIDGIKVPAKVDPKTGHVSTDAPVRPGQFVEVSYHYTEDP
jgi:hypothetical protein